MVPALLHQIQQHARIDAAAARAHHQPVQRGKTHGGGDAAAAQRGAQAGAAAQVGHHHALVGPGTALLQHRHDVLV
ncbi:hypothetical protein SDC9_177589 [bioreactor metagenome]|uniref:Uncharacterized protein n=1 Tax=bioreactor metagenome TaxID=1076179 RepID=A0A645GTF1_9ZZZZ